MRHQVRGRKLGRTSSHRKATLEALSSALIKNERITTTLPKAKELRRFVEPLITRSKVDNLLNRRIVFSALRDKEIVKKIFEEVGPLVADRPGGYTRIIKVGNRSGDGAPVAIIELVDYNDSVPETAGKKKKRTRRGTGKAKDETETTAKAESKKPAKETAAAPVVQDEETAPVAEQSEAVEDVKAEAAEQAVAEEEKAEAKTEEAAAEEAKEEAKAEAADENTAKEEKADAKAEKAEEAAVEEAKEEAAEKAAAKEEKAEAKTLAADDTEKKADAGSDTTTSSDEQKEDDDKKKSDK